MVYFFEINATFMRLNIFYERRCLYLVSIISTVTLRVVAGPIYKALQLRVER